MGNSTRQRTFAGPSSNSDARLGCLTRYAGLRFGDAREKNDNARRHRRRRGLTGGVSVANKKGTRKRAAKPPPKCKAFLLCDQTIVEAGTGKVSIIGVFGQFVLQGIPDHTTPCMAFLQLTSGIGQYDIVVEVHEFQDNTVIGRGLGIGVSWPDKLQTLNVIIPVPPIPILHEGVYDMVAYANGQLAEQQRFSAVLRGTGGG